MKKKVGVERSVGAVVFRKTPQGIMYLLLQHPDRKGRSGHWAFPKGHIERGEKSEDTLRREVREETGISNLKTVPEFKRNIRYFVGPKGKKRLKFVALFLAYTQQKKVKISFEHQGYAWLPYKEAYSLITYRDAKNVLRAANQFLRRFS